MGPSSVLCDLVILLMVTLLILFSIFSVAFILHFHQKTRKYHLLRDFNSLWPVRLLLVVSALLFSISELLRLSRFRRSNYLSGRFPVLPVLPVLSVLHHIGLCKIYIVASQGLFQPAFFITLLFLLNASLRKPDYEEHTLLRALTLLLFACLPLFLLHTLFVFFSERVLLWLGEQGMLIDFLRRHSHVEVSDADKEHYALCAYPIFSTLLLTAFGALYVVCFAIVCWRTVELVINRSLRFRVYGLAFAVLSAIPAQAGCLFLSAFWEPQEAAFDVLSTVAFLSVLLCALVGEGILVIRPIVDSLAVGG